MDRNPGRTPRKDSKDGIQRQNVKMDPRTESKDGKQGWDPRTESKDWIQKQIAMGSKDRKQG